MKNRETNAYIGDLHLCVCEYLFFQVCLNKYQIKLLFLQAVVHFHLKVKTTHLLMQSGF